MLYNNMHCVIWALLMPGPDSMCPGSPYQWPGSAKLHTLLLYRFHCTAMGYITSHYAETPTEQQSTIFPLQTLDQSSSAEQREHLSSSSALMCDITQLWTHPLLCVEVW